jgi:hypothetical protein
MNYNTTHQNFIILSKLSMVDYLGGKNTWTKLIKLLTPVMAPIKGVHNITAEQYVRGEGPVKVGRLTWKNEVLHTLVDNYEVCASKDQFVFDFFCGYFPSLTSCMKANVTPLVTLNINDANDDDRKFFGSGFFISFRQDYYDKLGEKQILSIIEDISALLKSVLRLKVKRSYAKPYAGGWTDSLQDLFPIMAANAKNGKLTISKEFKNWKQF